MKQASIQDLALAVTSARTLVERAEEARQELRTPANRAELAQHDLDTVALRRNLAGAYLELSKAKRDADDHAGALEAAKLYGEQERLAIVMEQDLAREFPGPSMGRKIGRMLGRKKEQ